MTTQTHRRGALLLSVSIAIAGLTGCDPAYTITGRVHAKGGGPIAGAQVQTVCPDNQPPLPSGTSDANGKLDVRDLGGFRDDCVVKVSAPGYVPLEFPVTDICTNRSRFWGCLGIDIDAELVAAP
jgi:hypothetical protein